jgi:hypothetical protein
MKMNTNQKVCEFKIIFFFSLVPVTVEHSFARIKSAEHCSSHFIAMSNIVVS